MKEPHELRESVTNSAPSHAPVSARKRFIAEVRTLDALNALVLDFPGITPVSQRICFPNADLATMESSGETESSSAGTQLGKGYPGLRCAQSASGPCRQTPSGAVLLDFLGHRSYASKILAAEPQSLKDVTSTCALPG